MTHKLQFWLRSGHKSMGILGEQGGGDPWLWLLALAVTGDA